MIRPDLELALTQIGVEEWPGDKHNPIILSYLRATPVGNWSPYDETAWCGAFIAWCKRGVAVPDKAHRARAWLRWGELTHEPVLGDIAVLKARRPRARGRTGSARGGYHVGYFMDRTRGGLILLSGNTDDRVGIDFFSDRKWETRGFRTS